MYIIIFNRHFYVLVDILFILLLILLIVLRSLFLIQLEPVNFGNERSRTNLRFQFGEGLQKDMREWVTKVSPVHINELHSRDVYFVAFWTVHLYPGDAKVLTHSYRKDQLLIAKYPWTGPENALWVFFFHHLETFRGQNEPGVDQTVEVHRWLIEV